MRCCTRSLGMLGLALFLAAAVGLAPGDDQKSKWKGDVYTLDVCVVSGQKLGSMGEIIIKNYDGREVRFCCESCIAKYEAAQDKFNKQIDEQLTEQQIKHYPLTKCVVMEDDPVEGMHGEPAMLVYRNRLVRFCCSDCIKDFKAEPDQYIAKLDAAVIAQQKDKYPLETCPVSGEKLGGMGEPVNYVVGTTLVRLCCNGCVKKLEKDPLPVIAKVHEAWMASHATDKAHGEKPAAPASKTGG